MKHSVLHDMAVFILLLAIGIFGRWGQPAWAFTPIAAVAIFSGFYFGFRFVSVLVPLAILGISDFMLPAYGSRGVMFVLYVAMTAPVALGWYLRRPARGLARIACWSMVGLMPAILFYLTTNWAVWFFQGAALGYAPSLEGLLACYAMAIPFFRMMLAGDIVYLGVLFGAYAVAARFAPSRLRPVPVRIPNKSSE
ncbi:MAG: hypothetical protein JW829_08570 [Pirellulales bacterium]|nr:hypothetical protein [Pirellulales bacterium]